MIRQLLVMTFVGGMLWFPAINEKTVSFLIEGHNLLSALQNHEYSHLPL